MNKALTHKRFIEKLARDAGSLLKRRMGKIEKVSFKDKVNLVTDVDKRCEDIILQRVKSSYPNHCIISEESGKSGMSGSEYLWLIDPLDGTTNYAHGFNFFCVSIALMKAGKIIAGAVCDPLRNELFSAAKGSGAFLNGNRIEVSGVRRLDKALLSTGFPYRFGKAMRRNIENFSRFMMKAQAVRRPGSAALDLCYVASGRFDGFWEAELNPWDTAAGALIVEEAGGRVSDFGSHPFNPFMKQILATNKKLHSQMAGIIK